MANFPVKNARAEKGTVQIGHKCVDSSSKRLICISFIEIQDPIVLFLDISEA